MLHSSGANLGNQERQNQQCRYHIFLKHGQFLSFWLYCFHISARFFQGSFHFFDGDLRWIEINRIGLMNVMKACLYLLYPVQPLESRLAFIIALDLEDHL